MIQFLGHIAPNPLNMNMNDQFPVCLVASTSGRLVHTYFVICDSIPWKSLAEHASHGLID